MFALAVQVDMPLHFVPWFGRIVSVYDHLRLGGEPVIVWIVRN